MIPHDGSGGRVELAGTLARGLIAWCPILRGRSPQKDAQVTKPELRVISTKKSRTRNDRAAKNGKSKPFPQLSERTAYSGRHSLADRALRGARQAPKIACSAGGSVSTGAGRESAAIRQCKTRTTEPRSPPRRVASTAAGVQAATALRRLRLPIRWSFSPSLGSHAVRLVCNPVWLLPPSCRRHRC